MRIPTSQRTDQWHEGARVEHSRCQSVSGVYILKNPFIRSNIVHSTSGVIQVGLCSLRLGDEWFGKVDEEGALGSFAPLLFFFVSALLNLSQKRVQWNPPRSLIITRQHWGGKRDIHEVKSASTARSIYIPNHPNLAMLHSKCQLTPAMLLQGFLVRFERKPIRVPVPLVFLKTTPTLTSQNLPLAVVMGWCG